jgi:hypothetical protein
MNLKEIKKAAYKAIVENKQSHQSFFDEHVDKVEIGRVQFAEEISKIPSKSKMEKHQAWIITYIILMLVIIILRSIALPLLFSQLPTPVLLLLLVIGIIVPVFAIYSALKAKVDFYKAVAILMGVNLLRSFTKGQFSGEISDFIGLAPVLIVIVLAFYIPQLLKSKYTETVVQEEVDGVVKKVIKIEFEKEVINDDKLLDSKI